MFATLGEPNLLRSADLGPLLRVRNHLERVAERNLAASDGAIHDSGSFVHCQFGSTPNGILEEFARRRVANYLELDHLSRIVRERDPSSWGPVEAARIDRDVSPRVERVDRRAMFCYCLGNFLEGLHRDLTVPSVLVSIAGDAMAVLDFDRVDRSHVHSGSERDLQRDDGSHGHRVRDPGYGGSMDSSSSRIPPPPGEEEIPIHTRVYEVKAYRVNADHMRLRGRVTDTKPPGLYIRGDSDPLDAHDMCVDLVLSFPLLEIKSIDVVLDTHPHESCPSIEPAFQQLVGSSIARGFGRQLTELFGGPRGCTHVVALLRAMGPVAVQSIYSMEAADPNRDPAEPWDADQRTDAEREQAVVFIRDTCHVWAADGERMTAADSGEPLEAPIWIRERLDKLGRGEEFANWH